MTDNFNFKCRTCLSDSNDYHQIFDYVGDNYKILDMLDGIVPQIDIKNSSQFSTLICQICVDKLLNGFKFQQMCIKTNDQLNNLSSTKLFEEVPKKVLDPLADEPNIEIKHEIIEDEFPTDELEEEVQTDYDNREPNDDAGSDTNSSNEKLSILKRKLPHENFSKSDHVKKKYNQNIQQTPITGTVCNICEKDFRYNSKLKQHMMSHNNERPFSCNQCDKTFRTAYDLRYHIRTHSDETPYACSQCNKSFRHLTNLNRHLEIHSDLKKYQCTYCSSRFHRSSNLRRHEAAHLNNKDPKTFKRVQAINADMTQGTYIFIKKISQGNERTEKSGSRNGSQEVLKTNVVNYKKAVEEDQHNVKCPKCSECFNSETLLTAHCNKVHEKSDLLATCIKVELNLEEKPKEEMEKVPMAIVKEEVEYTQQIFETNMPESDVHKNSDDNSLEKGIAGSQELINSKLVDTNSHEIEKSRRKRNCNFPCEGCGQIFQSASRLKKHSPVHSMERPHECKICKYRFETAVYLKIHLGKHICETKRKLNCKDSNSVRPKEKLKPVCTTCGKTFANNYNLKEHMRLHSGERPFKCDHCGKEFRYSSGLKEHMRVHSGECPYKCPHCGDTFRYLSGVTRHIERHTAGRNYQCSECSSRFKCKSDVTLHIKYVHLKTTNSQKCSELKNNTPNKTSEVSINNIKQKNDSFENTNSEDTFERKEFSEMKKGLIKCERVEELDFQDNEETYKFQAEPNEIATGTYPMAVVKEEIPE